MEWSNEKTLQFLELYSNEGVLWDPLHKQHRLKHKQHDAWKRISKNLNNINIEELKSKKKSLMTTFRFLLKKKKASIRSGAGADEVFQPIWYAYDIMESFLGSVYDVPDIMNTEDEPQSSENMENMAISSQTQNQNEEKPALLPSQNEDSPKTTVTKQLAKYQTTGKKRKFKSPQDTEVEEAQKKISQSLDILNQVLKHQIMNEKERKIEVDDCDLYAKLLARKLRRYPELMRERIMHKIDGLLLEENPYPIKRPSSDY